MSWWNKLLEDFFRNNTKETFTVWQEIILHNANKAEFILVAADSKRFSIISPYQASTLGNYYKQLLETRRWTWKKLEREFGFWPLGMIILNMIPTQVGEIASSEAHF